MKLTWLFYVLIFLQDDAPLKPSEEFEVKLNFEFKDRPTRDPNRIELDQTQKEYERSRATGPLPYLYINLKVLKQSPEIARIRIVENRTKTVLNKKFDMNSILKLDMGFTDDIKDRISAYEYTIYFLTGDKDPVDKIVIYFEEDGTYLLNGEKRGKL